jgi:hypothetical protein
MKKYLMVAGLFLVVLSGCAYSQKTDNSLVAAGKHLHQKPQYVNDINIRAMRDFVKRYSNVTDEKWHKSNNNYVAVFFRDSTQYRVIYSSRGELCYIMKYYEEPQMARDIRGQVKSIYYDYKIFIIQEIDSPDSPPVYIINLQGADDWKKIKLCQGEMEVMEEYKRSK